MEFTDEELEQYLILRNRADEYLNAIIRRKRAKEYLSHESITDKETEKVSEAYNNYPVI